MKRLILIFASMFSAVSAMAVSVDPNMPKTIKSDKIEYDVRSESIKTTGNTEITNSSGQRLTLTDSYLSRDGRNLSGDDIKIWLGEHVYIESDNIVRNGDDTIAYSATFTACDDCDDIGDAWQISTTRTVHDMDTRMLSFHNPVMWIYGVPALWLPYFSMPDPGIKHKTGFLMPDLKSTNQMGTQINIPLYIYLSDTHDMTITASYLTQENPLVQIEHRLNTAHSESKTNLSFTHNRDGENRWHIFNDDIIELGDNARATVFLERASDKTYLQKYGFYGDQPYLDSGVKLELFGQSSYVVADTHIFQELRTYNTWMATPSGDILPNIRATHQTSPLFAETYATFGADILGISGSGTSSQRMIGDARITSPWTLWGGNRLTLSMDARYDVYHFNNTDLIDGQKFSGLKNRFLPSGYVEWGLPLFRPSDTWTQVIEPRARLTIMRHIDDASFARNNDSVGALLSDATLFSNKRFAGLDLWENSNYADYGVRWAAFNPDGRSVEVFLGQTYDFQDRDTIDPNSGFLNGASDYVGRVGFNNMKWLEMTSRFRLARNDLALRHIETSAYLTHSAGTYLSIGHIWSQQFIDTYTKNDSINEFMGGFGIQLTPRWAVRFNSIYNMTTGAFQRHTGGVFYTHPCYYMSMEYRRDNAVKGDYVGTTTFQFRIGMSINGQQY